ncbi:UNVERIFIED_CONTAM: hypothetical protein K2H54_056702 [Gekko kuhli]
MPNTGTSYDGTLRDDSKCRHVTQHFPKHNLCPQTIKKASPPLKNDQKLGVGDRTSCVKPHPEQASPRFTVNKYSLLAALPSTVTVLAPITFQVQTGKQRKASEMADMRFNLLFTAVFFGGVLPILQDCQLPGITPGPSFFLLTFIIVL